MERSNTLILMGTLYIVATPIGNLEDITLRALRILKEVDFILCEDTRVTRILLDHYGIKTPTISYHQHSKLQKLDYIADLLQKGKNLALVSDAGTPGISDPGNELISWLVSQVASLKTNEATHKLANYPTSPPQIIPIPGASAVTAAASISGLPTDRFLFLGYPPQKKKRKKFFEEVASSKYPVVFYESPYRIIKTLRELQSTIDNQQLPIVVSRELTKKFETIYRGTIEKVLQEIQNGPIKGEFVVVVGQNKD